MCLSMLGNIIYTALMITDDDSSVVDDKGLALTAVSMFTPGWRAFVANETLSTSQLDPSQYNVGLFSFLCQTPNDPDASLTTTTASSASSYCANFWANQPTWEKVVIVAMCLTLITQAVAIVWSFVTFCACCCKQFLVHPLPILAFVAGVFVTIAVAIYGIKNKIAPIPQSIQSLQAEPTTSYSFYIACGDILCMVAALVTGTLTVTLSKHCL